MLSSGLLFFALFLASGEAEEATNPLAMLRATLRHWRDIYKTYTAEMHLGYCWTEYFLELQGSSWNVSFQSSTWKNSLAVGLARNRETRVKRAHSLSDSISSAHGKTILNGVIVHRTNTVFSRHRKSFPRFEDDRDYSSLFNRYKFSAQNSRETVRDTDTREDASPLNMFELNDRLRMIPTDQKRFISAVIEDNWRRTNRTMVSNDRKYPLEDRSAVSRFSNDSKSRLPFPKVSPDKRHPSSGNRVVLQSGTSIPERYRRIIKSLPNFQSDDNGEQRNQRKSSISTGYSKEDVLSEASNRIWAHPAVRVKYSSERSSSFSSPYSQVFQRYRTAPHGYGFSLRRKVFEILKTSYDQELERNRAMDDWNLNSTNPEKNIRRNVLYRAMSRRLSLAQAFRREYWKLFHARRSARRTRFVVSDNLYASGSYDYPVTKSNVMFDWGKNHTNEEKSFPGFWDEMAIDERRKKAEKKFLRGKIYSSDTSRNAFPSTVAGSEYSHLGRFSLPDSRNGNDEVNWHPRRASSLPVTKDERFMADYGDSSMAEKSGNVRKADPRDQGRRFSDVILVEPRELASTILSVFALHPAFITILRTLAIFVRFVRQINGIIDSSKILTCTKDYLWGKILKWIDS